MNRLSDLRAGDTVELLVVSTVNHFIWGGVRIGEGAQGTLGQMYRVQDGLEIWPMWLTKSIYSKSLLAVTHLQVRRVVAAPGEKEEV